MGHGESQGAVGEVNRAEPDSEHHCSPVLRSSVASTGDPEGAGGGRRAAPPAPALPCHNSNSCIEKEKKKTEPLSPYRKKSRHRLIGVVEGMVKKHGVNRVGLLTLSFGVPGSGRGSEATRELRERAKDLDFVQARWHSFASNVVTKRYEDWICVLEPHRDGVWHLHVVVATKVDIRTGTDIETLTNYKLPYWLRRGKQFRNEALAAEWRLLRETCCKYRFGRAELLPIKKTGEALARYVAGYLSKSFGLVPSGRKNRLVRYSRSLSQGFTMLFAPHNLGNMIYQTRLKLAASMLHFQEYGDFADYFGSRWHYYLGAIIAAIPMPLVFDKGEFENGVAALMLREFAKDPMPFLDEAGKKKMIAAQSALLRKFTDLACDVSAERRWQESQPAEADNIDVGPVTEADLQGDLIEATGNPF
jgi:hypothetical protein